ncbi:hypothetical protein SDRG_04692 [Saprolegnia diclina VS20]|uniref:Uncharacterized protein n=1 Tax=Saprolegnia diclina (strain VS20) TaxID=1156394 RepID=T0S6A1_SAPDV|nr:hypothetical protein SDRG_04692 [Saprolegnia diclina VS20]EQC38267.1 hypothetical protein SDRG_04692 [Saprolegnia diclina VS20]|eukprot:XP_008608594.1 hypothetical protein SDRG_04692 [Saprolegnia diclina VS20]
MPARSLESRLRAEVPPNLRCIEETIASLPAHLRGPVDARPLRMYYLESAIHTYRENDHLQPSPQYVDWAASSVLLADPRFRLLRLSTAEAQALAVQEWRTHLTRSVYQARLNPHEMLDGPVVTRSKSGVIRVQAELGPHQVIDSMSAVPIKKQSRAAKTSKATRMSSHSQRS